MGTTATPVRGVLRSAVRRACRGSIGSLGDVHSCDQDECGQCCDRRVEDRCDDGIYEPELDTAAAGERAAGTCPATLGCRSTTTGRRCSRTVPPSRCRPLGSGASRSSSMGPIPRPRPSTCRGRGRRRSATAGPGGRFSGSPWGVRSPENSLVPVGRDDVEGRRGIRHEAAAPVRSRFRRVSDNSLRVSTDALSVVGGVPRGMAQCAPHLQRCCPVGAARSRFARASRSRSTVGPCRPRRR